MLNQTMIDSDRYTTYFSLKNPGKTLDIIPALTFGRNHKNSSYSLLYIYYFFSLTKRPYTIIDSHKNHIVYVS